MQYDRHYLLWALSYAILGMLLGMVMAASHNHGQLVTHAHILLVGFVVSLIYAVIHKLWLASADGNLPMVQFVVHQVGAVVMVIGLFLLYGGYMPMEQLDPVLGISATAVLAAAIMMMLLVLRSRKA